MRFIRSAIFIIAVLVFPAFSTFAQENEAQVIDEVVAQVNDGVITLSQVKRETKNAIEGMVQQGKTPEAAKAELDAKQGELIANIINEELLLQKGKELGVENDVEAEVNRQFIAIMKEQGLKSLEALYDAMRKAGVNPDDVRENYRRKITKDMVLQNEVDRKVYLSFASSEIKKYYEEHKDKLIKPETVTLSEIFLNYAGRDQDAQKAKAYELVSKLRNGADFAQLAVENSDRPEVKTDKGKVNGTWTIEQIKGISEKFVEPIQKAKAGSVTDPIMMDDGIEIFRVDERKEANNEFDENTVRGAMTYDKLPEARKKFFAELRKESFVKVAENYRALVMPFWEKENTAEVTDGSTATKKPADNKKKNQ